MHTHGQQGMMTSGAARASHNAQTLAIVGAGLDASYMISLRLPACLAAVSGGAARCRCTFPSSGTSSWGIMTTHMHHALNGMRSSRPRAYSCTPCVWQLPPASRPGVSSLLSLHYMRHAVGCEVLQRCALTGQAALPTSVLHHALCPRRCGSGRGRVAGLALLPSFKEVGVLPLTMAQ